MGFSMFVPLSGVPHNDSFHIGNAKLHSVYGFYTGDGGRAHSIDTGLSVLKAITTRPNTVDVICFKSVDHASGWGMINGTGVQFTYDFFADITGGVVEVDDQDSDSDPNANTRLYYYIATGEG